MRCGVHTRILKCIVLSLAMGYMVIGLMEITYCKHILSLDPVMFIINIFLIPYVGCYGALKDRKYALVLIISYMVLAINLVDEVGVWSLDFGDSSECKRHLETYALEEVPNVKHLLMRTEIQCCGIYGPRDYGNSTLPIYCCLNNKSSCNTGDNDVIKTGCIEVCNDVHRIQQEIKIVLLINAFVQIACAVFAFRLAYVLPKEKLAQKIFV